jgi:undecaprenyl-diphosphatase
VNAFDRHILEIVNQPAQVSWAFDHLMEFVSRNQLVKGGALMLVFWWSWFRQGERQARVRALLTSALCSCFVAMIAARSLAVLTPFRLRPLHHEGLGFLPPYGMDAITLSGWSSFPSDHAVVFFTLSVGMFAVSRRVGMLALSHTVIIIALPRLYLGLHYPTDLLGGAAVGIAVALVGRTPRFVERVAAPISRWADTRPALFYPALFLTTYQVADMFQSGRAFARFFLTLFQGVA